jgi:hypothetical protein
VSDIVERTTLRVSGNRVLRRIFGPKKDEVIGRRRKLHSEQLNNLFHPPNIFRMIKSKRMRCARHVARRGDKRNACRIAWDSQRKQTTRKT